MKKYLKLVPAIAMVVLAAILAGTATYAWFAMNKNVEGTDIVIKAEVESDGIVISNSDGLSWSNTASAKMSDVSLLPTSTRDASTWYYNTSRSLNNAQASQADATYTTLTLEVSETTYGFGYVDADGDHTFDYTDSNSNGHWDLGEASEKKYYLLNTFTIKPSSGNNLTTDLYINSVTATGVSTSENFDAALRIAIKVAGDTHTYIFAPVAGATTTYKVGGSSTADLTAKTVLNTNIQTDLASIPAGGVAVSVYAYFEGEDANCTTLNAIGPGITLDSLHANIIFGTQANTFAVTQNLTDLTSDFTNQVFINESDLVIDLTPTSGSLPTDVTVTIGGDAAELNTDYTYSAGTITIRKASIDGNIVITAASTP